MTATEYQLQQRLQQQIQKTLLERAARLYPNDTRLQMIYQIGFLEAQLARACLNDSLTLTRFFDSVDR